MNKKLQIPFMMLSIVCAININAQNPNGLHTNKSFHKIESSENILFTHCSENVIQGHILNKNIVDISTIKSSHMLTIIPKDEWESIVVHSNSGYNNSVTIWDNPNGFAEEVPDDNYDILITNYDGDIDVFTFSVYDFEIDDDYIFTPYSYADAVYSINVHALDENGLELSDNNVNLMWYDVYLVWPGGVEIGWLLGNDGVFYSQLAQFRFNKLNERCKVSTHSVVFVDEQTAYYVEYPSFSNISENPQLTNNYEAYSVQNNYFSTKKTEESTYYLDYYQYINDYWFRTIGYDEVLCYNPEIPYKVISNIDVKNPSVYENGEFKVKLMPCALQSYPSYDFFEDKIVAPGIYNNEENLPVAEPFDVFEQQNFRFHDSGYPVFQPTPIAENTVGRSTFYYGERTPILYYQSQGYNETSSPYGYMFYFGQMLFIGENGCQRINDENSTLTIYVDGEESFSDSMYYFNWYENYYMPEEQCHVDMDIVNENCVVGDVIKRNHTAIEFDLHENDAMPPTMTIMRVLDQENKERVYIQDYSSSKILFAAGDFTCHVNEMYGGIDHMQYFAKPEVEVFYAIEGGEWMSLQFSENEELFHPNYGNVFTIELNQLGDGVVNHWIDLKFIVTDEAGNSQTQELSNVFFAGELTSVNEITANSLSHTVYPNPFTNNVTINAAEPVNGVATFTVYNTIGEMVYSSTMNCNETTEFRWDAADNANGVYLYQISTEKGMIQGRVVKE